MKYIVITGGVISGIGKGVTASCIGRLLQSCGFKVTAIKIDPYLNVDAGTMSPWEHGEVYVLRDGGEVDPDLGTYERLLGIYLTSDHSLTGGKIYGQIIQDERSGKYLGTTIRIHHISQFTVNWIETVANRTDADICLVELGGTVGTDENEPYLRALSELRKKRGKEVINIHIPYIVLQGKKFEKKTIPAQSSIQSLGKHEIVPDMIICRCIYALGQFSSHPDERKYLIDDRISRESKVDPNNIFWLEDVDDILEIPAKLHSQNIEKKLLEMLNDEKLVPVVSPVPSVPPVPAVSTQSLKLAVIGKYVHNTDAYMSIRHAIRDASCASSVSVHIDWIDSGNLTDDVDINFDHDAFIVPGGFGGNKVDGMIRAIRWIRENQRPFLGICLGMQCAAIELARVILNEPLANSTEFSPDTPVPIIKEKEANQANQANKMRKGEFPVNLVKNTQIYSAYNNATVIHERFRHKYAINQNYATQLMNRDNSIIIDPEGNWLELKDIPFIAVQFHPEFLTRPERPACLFKWLLEKARDEREEK